MWQKTRRWDASQVAEERSRGTDTPKRREECSGGGKHEGAGDVEKKKKSDVSGRLHFQPHVGRAWRAGLASNNQPDVG